MRAAIILLPLFAPTATAQEAAPAMLRAPCYRRLSFAGYRLVCLGDCLTLWRLLFLRRFNGVGRSLGGKMRVISSIGLGQRERAVLFASW